MRAIIFVFLFSSSLASAEFDPAWKECETNSECIKAESVCSSVEAINKKFRQKHQKATEQAAMLSSCIELSESVVRSNREAKVACLKGRCELVRTKN